MATNFKITQAKSKSTPTGHYVVEREWKAEKRKVEALEKELKSHEKTSMEKAHPPMSHEQRSQKDAPLPNMRK
jgi:hypothetical protein